MNTMVAAISTPSVERAGMIARLEDARLALADATDVPELKKIADRAAVAEAYARRQRLGEELEVMARRIKLDAMRRIGELLQNIPKNARSTEEGRRMYPSLDELGINSVVSTQARKLASLDKDHYERLVKSGRSLTGVMLASQVRTNRQSSVKAKEFLKFPLLNGKPLRRALKDEVRECAESMYQQAQTMAREARWLALLASKMDDPGTQVGHIYSNNDLKMLWDRVETQPTTSPLQQ